MSDPKRHQGPPDAVPPPDDSVARLLALADPRPRLSAERAARLKAAVRPAWQETARGHARRRLVRGGVAGLAAAAALAGLIVGLSGWPSLPRQGPPTPERHPLAIVAAATGPISLQPSAAGREQRLAAPLGRKLRAGDLLATGDARVALRLDGSGSSVRLDAGSTLRLLAPGRLALDAGAVYVDSAAGAGSGVEIVTPLGVVYEIGTQFEVRLSADALRVRVREGVVILRQDQGSVEARRGDQLTAKPGQAPERVSVATYGEPWRWVVGVAPPFDLEGENLAGYLRWISRELGREVRFASPALERLASEAGVHADLGGLAPEETLEVVLPACGVRHRFAQGLLIVEPAVGG